MIFANKLDARIISTHPQIRKGCADLSAYSETSTRDSQKSALYAADQMAEDILRQSNTDGIICVPADLLLYTVAGFLNRTMTSHGFIHRYGTVEVLLRLNDRASRSSATGKLVVIGSKRGGVSKLDVLHELAHVVMKDIRCPHHGEGFSTVFLFLVGIGLGLDKRIMLQNCFDSKGVVYSDTFV